MRYGRASEGYRYKAVCGVEEKDSSIFEAGIFKYI